MRKPTPGNIGREAQRARDDAFRALGRRASGPTIITTNRRLRRHPLNENDAPFRVVYK